MYVLILEIAARESQDAVADALRHLLQSEQTFYVECVRKLVADVTRIPAPTDIRPPALDLRVFDGLFNSSALRVSSREEMEVLFTLLAERYERGSVLLTSNLAFSKWDQIFVDAMTTAAAIASWITA